MCCSWIGYGAVVAGVGGCLGGAGGGGLGLRFWVRPPSGIVVYPIEWSNTIVARWTVSTASRTITGHPTKVSSTDSTHSISSGRQFVSMSVAPRTVTFAKVYSNTDSLPDTLMGTFVPPLRTRCTASRSTPALPRARRVYDVQPRLSTAVCKIADFMGLGAPIEFVTAVLFRSSNIVSLDDPVYSVPTLLVDASV